MTASLENKLVSKFYFYNFRFYLFRSVNINMDVLVRICIWFIHVAGQRNILVEWTNEYFYFVHGVKHQHFRTQQVQY